MNRFVHEELTRRWAEEEGFSAEEAAEIARWNWRVDVEWPGRPWRNRRYHHKIAGASRLSVEYARAASRERSLAHLGVALHLEQDAIAHGWLGSLLHWPGIDRWEKRSPRTRTRVEQATRTMLRDYLLQSSGLAGGWTAGGGDGAPAGGRERVGPVPPLPGA